MGRGGGAGAITLAVGELVAHSRRAIKIVIVDCWCVLSSAPFACVDFLFCPMAYHAIYSLLSEGARCLGEMGGLVV